MSLIWDDQARIELAEAADYYGHIADDLGESFVVSIEDALGRLQRSPLTYRRVRGEARRVHVTRFPYAIIYWPDDQNIYIVAVMHLHRQPTYWHGRVE